MSSVVEEFPKRHRGRPAIYPWDKYGDGQTHVCHRGVDYLTSTTSFRALIHRTANSRGLKADTHISKDKQSVTFKFFAE